MWLRRDLEQEPGGNNPGGECGEGEVSFWIGTDSSISISLPTSFVGVSLRSKGAHDWSRFWGRSAPGDMGEIEREDAARSDKVW